MLLPPVTKRHVTLPCRAAKSTKRDSAGKVSDTDWVPHRWQHPRLFPGDTPTRCLARLTWQRANWSQVTRPNPNGRLAPGFRGRAGAQPWEGTFPLSPGAVPEPAGEGASAWAQRRAPGEPAEHVLRRQGNDSRGCHPPFSALTASPWASGPL